MLNQVEHPTLEGTFQDSIDKNLYSTHTSLPGIIESVDNDAKKANVRVALKTKLLSETEAKELPILFDVPLSFFQTSETIISLPVKKGDDCMIFFCERSIDIWKANTAQELSERIVDPKDPRKHNLSDAFCVPICKPIGTGLTGDNSKIKIAYTEQNKMTIDENGHLKYEISDGSFLDIMEGQFKYTSANGAIFNINGSELTFTNPSGASFNINTGGKYAITNSSGDALGSISAFMSDAISAFSAIGPVVFPPPLPGIIANIAAMSSAQSELNGVKQ